MEAAQTRKTPDVLFQYMSYEKASTFFQDTKLRFKKPSDYNDPFEFAISENNSFPWQLLLGIVLPLPLILGLPFFAMYEWPKRVAHSLACKVISQRLSELFGVSCFSEERDNLLMWAHYARSYTGVVIGFRNSRIYWGNDMMPVNYSKEIVKAPVNFVDADSGIDAFSPDLQQSILVTKADCWAYEKEWRCVKTSTSLLSDSSGWYINLSNQAVVEVIFGYRIDPSKRIEMLKRAKQAFPKATFYEAWPNSQKYQLDISAYNEEVEEKRTAQGNQAKATWWNELFGV